MGVSRDRLVREMSLREFSASTQKLYLATLMDLAMYHQSPDTLDPTQIQNFLLYLTQERHLAWTSVSVAASAIRFFYTHTVKRLDLAMAMPSRRKPRRLPHILSVEEIERLLSTPRHPTHWVLLMTTCAAGLRVREVVRLQPMDLDRERLMIRVEQGKRRTDRYTILSPRLLTELDRYRAKRSLTRRLFPARAGDQPMSPSTAQHIFIAAKGRSASKPHSAERARCGSLWAARPVRGPSPGGRDLGGHAITFAARCPWHRLAQTTWPSLGQFHQKAAKQQPSLETTNAPRRRPEVGHQAPVSLLESEWSQGQPSSDWRGHPTC